MAFKTKKARVMEELGLRAGDLQASTLYRDAWNRLKKNKMAIASFFLLVIIALIAVFAPLIAPYDPYTQDLSRINEPPSSDHWFGTDDVGRDLFSRVVYGTRISMLVGVVCEAICVPIGVILGALAGAVICQRDFPVPADKQLFPQLLLQVHQLPRKRGLGQVQIFSCGGNIFFPRHSEKILHLYDIHDRLLPPF